MPRVSSKRAPDGAPSRKAPVIRQTHLTAVIERLKLGPLTQRMVPEIPSLKKVINVLRDRGWPITTEIRTWWDQWGGEHQGAEYRLGNWTAQALPFGGNNANYRSREARKPKGRIPAVKDRSAPEAGGGGAAGVAGNGKVMV